MRLLDGLLGPGLGGQEIEAPQRMGASRVHEIVRALPCGALAGMVEVAAARARSGAALGGYLHQWLDGERGHQSQRLAGRKADGAAAGAPGAAAPMERRQANENGSLE